MQPSQTILLAAPGTVALPSITSIQMITDSTFTEIKGLKGPDGVADAVSPVSTTFKANFTLFINTNKVVLASGSCVVNRQMTALV